MGRVFLLYKKERMVKMTNNIICRRAKDIGEEEKEKISKECFETADAIKFGTNYEDVSDHLFCDENSILTFIHDEKGKIKGFAISVNIAINEKESLLHLHGVILSKDLQKKGLLGKITSKNIGNIEGENCWKGISSEVTAISARTRNPALYKSVKSMCGEIYPESELDVVTEDIKEVLLANPFVELPKDGTMIKKKAYVLPKPHTDVSDKDTNDLFGGLEENDAVILYAGDIWNIDEKLYHEGLMEGFERELDSEYKNFDYMEV